MGADEAKEAARQLRVVTELATLVGKLLGSDAAAGRLRVVLESAPADLW